MGEELEGWNMALAYYKRIDDLLSYCTMNRMKGDGLNWFKGIEGLYFEVYPKLSEEQKEESEKRLTEIRILINEKKKKVPTHLFSELELLFRGVLDAKGMLTPKKDNTGL